MSVQVAVHRAREDSEIPYVNSSRPYDELQKMQGPFYCLSDEATYARKCTDDKQTHVDSTI